MNLAALGKAWGRKRGGRMVVGLWAAWGLAAGSPGQSPPDLTGFQPVPLHSEWTEAQPMTGIVLWPDEAEDLDATYGKAIAMEFAYCRPCDVVKGKRGGRIEYDWRPFEKQLDAIKGRRHQAVIRFRYEYPGDDESGGPCGATAVPAYIKARPDYHETFSRNPEGDGPTYYADWSNAELQWFTRQFYSDFIARYDADPRLAFLEVGFGHWAEYHIDGTDLKLGQNFPSQAYQAEFLRHVDSACRKLPWLVSIDASNPDYSPIVRSTPLMALSFGLFDDSFMHEEHEQSQGEGYNEKCWNAIGKGTRWKTAPCGGEISYYSKADQANFLNPKGMYGVTWEQAAAKYHMSFVIANDLPKTRYGTPKRMLEASLASGYRFRIEDFRTSGAGSWVCIANEGVAPIYREAFVAVNGVRGPYSLTHLLPGRRQWIFIASGGEHPIVSIECDHLAGRKIGFAADF